MQYRFRLPVAVGSLCTQSHSIRCPIQCDVSHKNAHLDFRHVLRVKLGQYSSGMQLSDVVSEHIPERKFPTGRKRKAIWMTYKALQLVRKKHKAYSRYKDTHHPAYRKAARAADEAIKSAKKKFESKLASNIKNDSKSFYAYVNSRCKAKVKVGPLVAENGEMVTEAVEMSEQLNEYFTSVFTREDLSQMPPDAVNTDTDTVYLSDINIDPVSVLNKLNRLRSDT